MFKVICELEKLKEPEYNRVALKYKNCQPCEFNNYRMFNTGYDRELQFTKITKVLELLEMAALDIGKSEYEALANKIYYINDLSNYRYITLLDESSAIENMVHIFDVPWIYSAIIRMHEPAVHYNLTLAWHDILSWFYSTSSEQLAPPKAEQFSTIWEKLFLFHVPQEEMNHRSPGTIVMDNVHDGTGRTFYHIDKYFLRYLFTDKENSKCIPFNQALGILPDSNHSLNTESDRIYEEYKVKLPQLFGLEFLEKLSKLRNCVNAQKSETIILSDEIDRFILTSQSKPETFNIFTLAEVCHALGGILIPVSLMVEHAQEQCASLVSKNIDDNNAIHHAGNELYQFNCYTMNATLAELGNITDYYAY